MASAILMAWQAYMIASSAYGTLGAKSYADVQDADVPDATRTPPDAREGRYDHGFDSGWSMTASEGL